MPTVGKELKMNMNANNNNVEELKNDLTKTFLETGVWANSITGGENRKI